MKECTQLQNTFLANLKIAWSVQQLVEGQQRDKIQVLTKRSRKVMISMKIIKILKKAKRSLLILHLLKDVVAMVPLILTADHNLKRENE